MVILPLRPSHYLKGYADGFVETLGVGACRINDPTGNRDVGAAIRGEGEAGCSEEDRCRKPAQHVVTGHTVPCHFDHGHLAAIVAWMDLGEALSKRELHHV